MESMAKRAMQLYMLQLRKRPLKTKAITAGLLSAVSDIVAQKLFGIQKIQLKRLLLKVIFGCAYIGPSGHFLHMLLDKLFKGKNDTITVAKKVVVDELTFSPCTNLIFMLYYGLVIEGRQWINVKSKIKKEFLGVQMASWTVWPIVGWINHQFVPLHFRVIFESVVACLWGIFLNLRARSTAIKKS